MALRDKVNDYEQTVKALLAFAALVVHDGTDHRPDSRFGFGRRMDTSSANKLLPNGEVRPDLTAQKSLEYGVVVEAKKSWSRDESRWAKQADQLRKYDDDLTGWWTNDERTLDANAVLLVHQSRSRAVSRFVASLKEEDDQAVGSRSVVVEFNSSEETASYYFFRTEFGSFLDEELDATLLDGRQVPLDKVVSTFSTVRYYDAPPPIPYLLTDLWVHVLPSVEKVRFDEEIKADIITVSAEDLSAEMQKAYGSELLHRDARSCQFPKSSWVKKCLDFLVTKRLAIPNEAENTYDVIYRHFKKDILDRFVEMAEGDEKTATNEEADQTELFHG
ncbi:MAG: hypothetical protein ACC655_05540 [Rhodothermia bacterium]